MRAEWGILRDSVSKAHLWALSDALYEAACFYSVYRFLRWGNEPLST